MEVIHPDCIIVVIIKIVGLIPVVLYLSTFLCRQYENSGQLVDLHKAFLFEQAMSLCWCDHLDGDLTSEKIMV
jgi:hypothetical protein